MKMRLGECILGQRQVDPRLSWNSALAAVVHESVDQVREETDMKGKERA